MSKISGKIYEWCAFKMDTFIDNDDCDELRALADRIDRELVELPKDAHGKPIHVGETVYDLDGYEHMAVSHRLYGEEDPTWMVSVGGGCVYPRDLTHKRPDSFERIADELDDCDNPHSLDENALHHFADRIRKLAKERGDE